MGGYIHAALGGEPLTLRRYTDGAQNTDVNAGRARTYVDYPCDGYPEAVESHRIPSALVREEMTVFGIYGDGLSVRPQTEDKIIDADGVVYVVYFVDGDSVRAVWVAYASRTGESA